MPMVEVVCRLLAGRWGREPELGAVFVEHHERVVFSTLGPADRRVVVKADRVGHRLVREAEVLSAAGAAGVPVPAVLDVIDGPPAILVMAFVDGSPLWESPAASWSTVGRQLRRFHDEVRPPRGVPMFGGGSTWWTSLRGTAARELSAEAARNLLPGVVHGCLRVMFAKAFDRHVDLAVRLLHGDCAPYHWLLRDGRVSTVVDFGDASLGDAAWDLVVLTRWDPDELPNVLAGYIAGDSLAARVREMFRPYSALRSLIALNWLVDHGRSAAPNVAELTRLTMVPSSC